MLPESIWFFVPVVALAALIRGYTGFGFAAIAVVGLNLFLTPQQTIPVILGLDLLCSIPLWRQAVGQADIPTFKMLTLGSAFGIPIGMGLLFLVPSEILKLAICISILVICLLLAMDVRFRGAEKTTTKIGFGMLAGAGTSSSSVGGPMVVSYMLSSPLTAVAQRATMILFFVVSELIAIAALFSGGLIDIEVIKLIAVLLIPTLIAVRSGQWLFNLRPPASLKHLALPIMAIVAILGISASVTALF